MLFWIVFITTMIVLIFCVVVFFGAPYLPTKKRQINTALDLVGLEEGQTLLELGSGDGRVLLAAAKRGYRAVGIELNPILLLISLVVTWRYRSQVRLIWGSYWGLPWPRADGVFAFMMPGYMKKLDSRIEQWHTKPVKLASFAFRIPGKEHADMKHGVYLYEYK